MTKHECGQTNTFRFEKPQTFGFSSGWANDFNPDGNYALTQRRNVSLEEIPARSILTGKQEIILLKNSQGSIRGISSGAGSSLYEKEGIILKIKRNGYKERGPTNEPFTYTRNAGNQTTETEEYRGILHKQTAINEYNAIQQLRKEGLCEAYKPIDILEYTIPQTNKKAHALITEVTSEVRLDEVILGIQGNILTEKIKTGELIFNETTGMFRTNNLDEEAFLNPQTQQDVYNIGYSLGSHYKEFHRKGWTRGYPHSWFGNEILNTDGTLSFVDLEDASKNKTNIHQQTERYQAQSALFAEFEHLGIRGLAHNAATLAQAFSEGYERTSRPIPIPQETIQRFIQYTQEANKHLWRNTQ